MTPERLRGELDSGVRDDRPPRRVVPRADDGRVPVVERHCHVREMCATGRSDATNLPRGSPRLRIGRDRGSPRGDRSPVSAWALALIPLHRSALLATQPGLRVDRLPLAPMCQTLGFDRCLQARDLCAGTRKLLTSARKVVGECFRSGGNSLRRHLGPLSTANGVAQLTLEDPAFDPTRSSSALACSSALRCRYARARSASVAHLRGRPGPRRSCGTSDVGTPITVRHENSSSHPVHIV